MSWPKVSWCNSCSSLMHLYLDVQPDHPESQQTLMLKANNRESLMVTDCPDDPNMPHCEKQQLWRCEDVKLWRCEALQQSFCQQDMNTGFWSEAAQCDCFWKCGPWQIVLYKVGCGFRHAEREMTHTQRRFWHFQCVGCGLAASRVGPPMNRLHCCSPWERQTILSTFHFSSCVSIFLFNVGELSPFFPAVLENHKGQHVFH